MSIGTTISYYRKKRGFTQEQLSEQIGVTSQAISKWENGMTNPDISTLPIIAKALCIDMNTLFDGREKQDEIINLCQLTDAEYESVLSLFLNARRTFYGIIAPITEEEKNNRLKEYKEKLCSQHLRSISICEGEDCHGSVYISDSFSFIDRKYGCRESACLFDMQKAGNMLSTLSDPDVRKVLKSIYKRLISSNEGATIVNSEVLSQESGLPQERSDEAAIKLFQVKLIDMHEKFENGEYYRQYSSLYTSDFIYVLAILRIAYAFAEKCYNYDTVMIRSADGSLNYDGPGNV